MTYTAKQIIEKLKEENPYGVSLYYVDYRDSLDEHGDVIQAVLEGNNDLLHERIDEWYFEQPNQAMVQACNDIGVDLHELDGDVYDEITEWFYDNDDSYPTKQLLRNTGKIKVRIEMTSNYDCGMSNHLHGGDYTYEETFFGSAIKGLGINPQAMKKALTGYKQSCYGQRPSRKDYGYINIDDFITEHDHTTAGRLPSFAVSVDLEDVYEAGGLDNATVTIKEGTPFGMMNDRVGTCSLYDARLQKDMTIKLGETTNDDRTIGWIAKHDDEGYGLDQVAGMTDSFWRKGQIEIK